MKIKILVAMLALYGCKSTPKTEIEDKLVSTDVVFSEKQFKNLPIELGSIQNINMEMAIAANGIVDVPPDKVFMISYPVNGFISSISHNLLPGRFVKKGETLATIKSIEILQLQEDYLFEATKNEFLVQENNRQKSLLADEATAKRKLQESENNLKINQLKIRALAEKLKLLGINPNRLNSANISATHQIIALNSGYVKTVNVANGKNFMPSEVLFEIVNTDHVHVELKIFGNDASKVKLGQNVLFDAADGQKVNGKVYLIDKTIDMEKKSLNIHVHIDNEAFEQTLRPGQFIAGKILANSKSVSALPESAILSTTDGKFVMKLNKNNSGVRFSKLAVKTGLESNGFVEILNPELLNGSIVLKGVSFIENSNDE